MKVQRKKIPGFDGYYADTEGNIWSTRRGRDFIRKPFKDRNGYLNVGLMGSKFKRYVHHLVLLTFVGERPRGFECRHLNGIRTDNRPQNLRWGTRIDNVKDKIKHGVNHKGSKNPSSKLTEQAVKHIRGNYKKGMYGYRIAMAKKYGVSKNTIGLVLSGDRWKHV